MRVEPRRWTKNRFYDKIHRTGVYIAVSTTVLAASFCLYKGVQFLLFTRPARKSLRKAIQEQKMAEEQEQKEKEFYGIEQKEGETLR